MKISTIFTTTFLVWVAYDTNLFRRTGDRYVNAVSINLELEAEAHHEIKKRKQLHRTPIPHWNKPIPPKLKMKVNHFSPKSKDPRYSDQQKIRRRINNM